MPARADQTVAPTHLTLLPWPDPVIDEVGHDPRSPYVERFWLGVIGPSCTWFLRRLSLGFDAEPAGFELDVAECARALGLGAGLGRNAPLGRTISRCCQFGLTRRFGRDGLTVRRRLPPLARHQLLRLPEALQEEHVRWTHPSVAPRGPEHRALSVAPSPAPAPAVAATPPAPFRPTGAAPDRQAWATEAGQLALRLLRGGHDADAAHQSLLDWGAPPGLARAAVEWATGRLGADAVSIA